MIRRNILAHRGCWAHVDDANCYDSIKSALVSGFGIETDFRDLNGSVVVSHDPPQGSVLNAKEIFELYVKFGCTGRIALNIKSDGLQNYLFQLLSDVGIPRESYYAFDMSVPDSLGYIRNEFPFYTRQSEYECNPPLLNDAVGVWVDNFSGSFDQVLAAKTLLEAGKRVCIVSAELHKRDFRELWAAIAIAGLHKNSSFELCTDFPEAAFNFFAKKGV